MVRLIQASDYLRHLRHLRIQPQLFGSRFRGVAALLALLGEDLLESIHRDTVAVVLPDVTEDFLAVRIEEQQGRIVDHLSVEGVAVRDPIRFREGGVGVAEERELLFLQRLRPFADFIGGIGFQEDVGDVRCLGGAALVVAGVSQADGALRLEQEVQDHPAAAGLGERELPVVDGRLDGEVGGRLGRFRGLATDGGRGGDRGERDNGGKPAACHERTMAGRGREFEVLKLGTEILALPEPLPRYLVSYVQS